MFLPQLRIRLAISVGIVFAGCLQFGPVATVYANPHGGAYTPPPEPTFVPLNQTRSLRQSVEKMADHRVVLVGETHDRYDHHLNQLSIIRSLKEKGLDIAVGLEFFQRPFQQHLDDYVAGRIDEDEMLRKTEYFRRWGFDYRLYQPILSYAREQKIPLLALNMESEVTSALGPEGLDHIAEPFKDRIPKDIDTRVPGYRERLQTIFNLHPVSMAHKRSFQRFLGVQLLWDETMAETAARYLRTHPGKKMVILAGSGHVQDGSGIPVRLQRRLPSASMLTVLQSDGQTFEADDADWLMLSQERRLPSLGKMGIFMKDAQEGVLVDEVLDGSAASEAGLKAEDVLVSLDGKTLRDTMDIRLMMRHRLPGETLEVGIRRPAFFGGFNDMTLTITLKRARH